MKHEHVPASLQHVLAGYNIPEDQLDACFHQAYSSVRNVITLHIQQGNLSDIRKIFVSGNPLQDNPVFIDMVNDGVVRLKDKVQVPILLLRRILNFAVAETLSIIMRRFSCNSVSKLLRYLGLNSVMVLSKEVRKSSIDQLKIDFAHNLASPAAQN